jgi:hypothetical protein
VHRGFRQRCQISPDIDAVHAMDADMHNTAAAYLGTLLTDQALSPVRSFQAFQSMESWIKYFVI